MDDMLIIKIGCAAMAVAFIALDIYQHVRLDRQQREIKKLREYISNAQDATIDVLTRETRIINSINDIDKRLRAVEANWWKKLKARLLK